MILRARLVLPLIRPPIQEGAVVVESNRIRWVGSWKDLPLNSPGPHIDLGEVLLMPGLINAHAHLEYTGMAGLIPPRRSFADWIKSINALKGTTTLSEFEQAWKIGADMLTVSGTTTVANISSLLDLLPQILCTTPLRVISFIEVIGIKPDRVPEAMLVPALSCLEKCLSLNYSAGLSPHSPYATTPALMRLCLQTALKKNWLLTTHLAESEDELEMFCSARGPMYDWLKTQRDMSDCGRGSPTAHLDQLGIPERRLLVAHANCLNPADIEILARRKVAIVHCPHSHAYFQHRPFPLKELLAAGVTICLGTDSLASREFINGQSPRLDMRSEMRVLTRTQPDLTSQDIVHMATLHGAQALGMQGTLGELSPGAWADLIVLPFSASSRCPYEEIIQSHQPVLASMREGQWIIEPGSSLT